MADIESTLIHNDVTYAATIVTINSTELGRQDHGIWHTMLHVSWDGGGTGLGGYVLDGKPEDGPLGRKRTPTAFGLQWIIETVETVCGEYGKWEDLKGKRIFMLHEPAADRYDRAGFNCEGIASLDGERVMIFEDVTSHVGELVS